MLNKSTISFLKNLAKHNNREWMQANRPAYEAARADFLQFTQQVLTGFAKHEPDLLPLQPKDCVFRQNRDVRFSADKSPYKINMGAAFSKGGKKSVLAGYYFHLEPGKSFVGGGLWMPDKALVQKVRQEIDYCWDEWQLMLKNKSFQKHYGDFSREPAMVLQREPKGYDKNNPAIAYLKMKSWVAAQPLTDAALTESDLVKNVIDAFKALQPFVHFMNRAIEG
ncbi:DUF2461 domain-containing protein [Hydrotalea sandarakina]|jgi:uncharacterized protein (TIGR02453 family)|uniref:Uncharacterized protein (TIGR02453 family) n=1 Tax=Hydrotalea sandarakina TaxID=1004304 RepID=A0A2W7RQX8_9BACT|nr:DUF2461 domain-containing protein [Hydrotalea sandarakina]PZX62781.1 uncharacterized protein (TIGR02453 family) [Hydrotalea sandarakina]